MSYPDKPEKRNESDLMVTLEIDINAPIETVFEVVEDIEIFVELEENVRQVTIVSDVKKGKGMKSHWVLEDMVNHVNWELDEEVIYYDKPRQFAYVGYNPDGKDYSGVHNLSQNPDGSTHLLFNECFHFDTEYAVQKRVISGMLENIKKVSEGRVKTS